MLQVLKLLSFALVGVIAGSIVGTVAGMAYMEFAQHGCTGATCADQIARTFIPGGAIGGSLAAIVATRPRERLGRF